ncbi:MAG TPA: PIN domain-containing protein [Candidatus Nanoarchaeia archaeon]|nr:PIN domain-containing protein [Candidatus Nanoarchaeia archaeon]
MRIVVDVNVVLSALIRNSSTRKLIFETKHELYFPEHSLHKLRKYQNYVIGKAGLNERDYARLLAILFRNLKVIQTEEIKENWGKAKEIMEHIDKEDVVFIAAALSLDNSAIWSEDKDFERQTRVKLLKTRDIVELFSS